MFSVGDSVTVADLADDTGFLADGSNVADLVNPGVIAEVSDFPPGVPADGSFEASPHYKVTLFNADGDPKEAWLCGFRLTLVG